ncbi:MAG: MFS transporter [Armatimonadetes bacterium]|nr:MFS transporter [Armatimonadota bacterium]
MELSRPIPLASFFERVFAPRHRAFWLVVGNGVLWQMSYVLVDGRQVIAALLMQLTGREWLVGLTLGMGTAVMSFPQLYAAYLMADGRARMPFYRFGAHVRWGAVAVLSVALALFHHRPLLLAGMVVCCLATTWAGLGYGSVAFGDIFARTVPARLRGRCFGLRLLGGGLIACALGGLVRRMLGEHSPLAFPFNYVLLFGISLVLLILGQSCFMCIDEPPLPARERPEGGFGPFVRHAASVLAGDRDALRYALFGTFTPAAWAPLILILPYALTQFGMHAGVAGWFVVVGVVAGVASNPFWAWASDRSGNRVCLRLTTALALAAVGLLALTPLVAERYRTIGGISAPLAWLLLVNAISEIALVGSSIGRTNYAYEIARDGDVPLYLAVFSAFTAPASCIGLPLLGWVAGRFGYPVVFAVAGLCGTAAVAMTLFLSEPRRRPPGGTVTDLCSDASTALLADSDAERRALCEVGD